MVTTAAQGDAIRHLALIGNFLPRQCGLATFTTDVWQAMRDRFPDVQVDVYAMDDHPGRYAYPPAVTGTIPQHDLSAYLSTARTIEASGTRPCRCACARTTSSSAGRYGGRAGGTTAPPW